MKMVKFIVWTILSFLICTNCLSQYKKNVIVLEIAGKSFGYFDISYERYLSERLHFGGGVGFAGKNQLYTSEEMFTKRKFTIPLYGAYAFGQKKHHLISEFGATIRVFSGPQSSLYFDGRYLFISVGYEYRGEKFIFRAPIYLTNTGGNEHTPSMVPWFGLSLGRFL